MATPKIIPRVDGEGSLGAAAYGWGGLFITNITTSSATEGGKLVLTANDGAVMGNDHRLGVIEFKANEDGASDTLSIGARIQAIARDAWNGSNNDADLEFYTTDGTTESKALTLDADNLATFTGDATITGGDVVLGAASDGADRSILFHHTTNPTMIGIDDSTDAFCINTKDGAFNADVTLNTFSIDDTDNVFFKKNKIGLTAAALHGDAHGDIVYFGSGTVAAGKIYHYKSDGSWEAADATDASKCDGLLGVALAAGTASTVGMLLRGMVTLIDIQGGEAVGDVLYLSETATGDADCVAPAAATQVIRIIGYCLSTDDQIWFNPDSSYIEL
tara:strand:- start:710 stop:1705 length:996 start_codon:yes stop_codon:yes gene_type:complete